MRIADSNVTVAQFVDAVRSVASQSNAGRNCFKLCRVVSNDGPGLYGLCVFPDLDMVIHNIPNMTRYDLALGDDCYVYCIGGSLNNTFIWYAKGAYDEQSTQWVQAIITAALAPLQTRVRVLQKTIDTGAPDEPIDYPIWFTQEGANLIITGAYTKVQTGDALALS